VRKAEVQIDNHKRIKAMIEKWKAFVTDIGEAP
jgi:hypothetical protein